MKHTGSCLVKIDRLSMRLVSVVNGWPTRSLKRGMSIDQLVSGPSRSY